MPTLRPVYVHWLWRGMTPAEAGNLTARSLGVHACRDGWTVKELNALLWLRWLVEKGRLDQPR